MELSDFHQVVINARDSNLSSNGRVTDEMTRVQ